MSDALRDEIITKALRRAYSLGQTYWQQADSESYSQNKKADATDRTFQALIADTRAALSAPPPVVPAGWQLVPVEPHPRLLNVLFGYWLDPVNNLKHRAIAAAEWRSMLAAAPQAPTHPGQAPTGGAE